MKTVCRAAFLFGAFTAGLAPTLLLTATLFVLSVAVIILSETVADRKCPHCGRTI